jgi:hypothetical protein
VRNGDLGCRLNGERVLVFVDPSQYEGSVLAAPSQVEVRSLLEFDVRKEPQLSSQIEQAYLARKSYYDPATMWQKLQTSSYQHNRDNKLRRAASLIQARMRLGYYWLAGWQGRASVWRQGFMDALRHHPIVEQYTQLLDELDARVVAAFSLEGPREMALMEAARKSGLKTLVMIRSRDNLAAKIHHLPEADTYCVWAEVTRDFLLHLYPEIPAEKVIVTGSPQFDRHLNPQFRFSREEFFQQIGLDPARPLVVYTCATPELVEHEIHIAQHLANAVRDGKLANNAQLLVRAHPRGFGSNYPILQQTYAGVAVYPQPSSNAYKSAAHEAEVVRLILQDEPMHLAMLAYQDVQVNISGTMMVDSAILDKPTVGIYYDIPTDIPVGLSVKRFYRRTDMKPIIESGGVKLARSADECIQLINRYLEDPTLEASGRAKIREQEAGPLDGQAGERIARVFRELANIRQ